MKISVDYGHCLRGFDTGAWFENYKEEVLTREVGKRVVDKLRNLGHTVLAVDLEQSHNVNSSLAYRKDAINTFKPNLSLSIHFNAGGGLGAEIYTDGYCNTEAARVINNFVSMGYRNRGIKDGMQLALVGGLTCYAMLIECCFIDTEDMNKYNAEKFANNIVNGILNIKIEEVEKVDNIVVFGNDIDKRAAEYLADYLQCAIISKNTNYNYANIKNVYCIGGKQNDFTSYCTKFIGGTDRYETIKNVLSFIGKL